MLNYKLCIILHTLYSIIKLQRALFCKILKSDTHVNEVSLWFWQIVRNPWPDDMCIIHIIICYYCFILGFLLDYSPLFPNYSSLFWNNSRILSNLKFPKIIPA